MPADTIPTTSDVERIAALSDPVLRNLQITQCYHELALPLMERTGGNANWCAFATWASKQAGQSIRKEDLTRMLEKAMLTEAEAKEASQDLVVAARRIGSKLGVEEILDMSWKVMDPEFAFTRSSDAVARGNRKVFAEIGREFARFYAACLDKTTYQAEKIALYCDQLLPGEPPDGQRYLRQAFQAYYQALFEEDEKARIELLLLANLEIGFHEQTRLQPEINEALAAPVISPQEFTQNLLNALLPGQGGLAQLIWLVLRLFSKLVGFEFAVEAYAAAARRQAQHIITETMMAIEMPCQQQLRLGEDLTAGFPPALQHISNPDLLNLLAQIDSTPDSTRESGAEYWGDLPDRLHFIADMFRCYAISPDMLEAPFTAEQAAALKEGRIPAGRL